MLSVDDTLAIMLTFSSDLKCSLSPKLIIWGIKVTLDKDGLYFPLCTLLILEITTKFIWLTLAKSTKLLTTDHPEMHFLCKRCP